MLYSKYEDILFFLPFFLVYPNKTSTFAPKLITGVIAQSVEQRTENPCVPGSIPGDTTSKRSSYESDCFFFCMQIQAKTEKCFLQCFNQNVTQKHLQDILNDQPNISPYYQIISPPFQK